MEAFSDHLNRGANTGQIHTCLLRRDKTAVMPGLPSNRTLLLMKQYLGELLIILAAAPCCALRDCLKLFRQCSHLRVLFQFWTSHSYRRIVKANICV